MKETVGRVCKKEYALPPEYVLTAKASVYSLASECESGNRQSDGQANTHSLSGLPKRKGVGMDSLLTLTLRIPSHAQSLLSMLHRVKSGVGAGGRVPPLLAQRQSQVSEVWGSGWAPTWACANERLHFFLLNQRRPHAQIPWLSQPPHQK